MRTILAQLQPFDTGTDARLDLYVGDSPSPIGLGLGGIEWETAFVTRPTVTVELMSPDMSGKVFSAKASFVLQLRNVENVPNIARKDFQGAPAMIWSCDDLSWTRRRLEFTGFVSTATLDPDTLTLSLDCDTSTKMLAVPLLWDQFGGTGGLDGSASLRGTLKPAGFGVVPGVEILWFDTVNNIGMVDGYGNLLSVERLLEGASAWSAKIGNYANYAALLAAIEAGAIGPGQWGTCIAEGLIGLGAPPHGVIMADCTFGYGTPGTIIPRVLEAHANVPADQIDLGSMANVDAALTAKLGAAPALHYWTKDQRQVDDLLGAVAGSANSSLLVTPQGLVTISRAVASDPVATLNRNGSVDPRVLNWKSAGSVAPFYLLRARAARPARVLSADEINYYDNIIPLGNYDPDAIYRPGNTVWMPNGSQYLYKDTAAPGAGNSPPTDGSLENAYWERLVPPTSYSDGTPIDHLEPAEVGANKTETHTASAIAGQGQLATANQVNLGSSGKVFQQNGTTPVTDATAITSLGTAAAIAGQGSLATQNAVDLSTTQVTNKSLANVDNAAAQKLNTIDLGATVGDNFSPNASSLGGYAFANLTPTAGGIADPVPNLGAQTAAGANATLTSDTFTLPASGTVLYLGTWAKPGASGQHFSIEIDWLKAGGLFLSSQTIDFFPTGTAWVWLENSVTRPTAAVGAAILVTAFASSAAAKIGGPRLSSSQMGSTLGSTLGTNTYQSNGTTLVTDSTAITSLGTAAAIAGQGALATQNSVDMASPQIVNKVAANITYTGGATVQSLMPAQVGADVTASNTAAAIAGQGGLATKNLVRIGGEIYRADGTTITSDAMLVTSLGTAAAITSQGALATLNSVDLSGSQVTNKTATNITYTGGATVDSLKPAQVGADVTSSHTAAAIASQGAFATLNSAAYGSSLLTGFGTIAARNNVRIGTELVRADGTTATSDAILVTSLGTAAAIASQGTLATLNAVDLATTQVVNKSLANLDAAASTKLVSIEAGATAGDNLITGGDFRDPTYLSLPAGTTRQAGGANDPNYFLRGTADQISVLLNQGVDRGLGAGLFRVTPGERLYVSAQVRTGGDTRNAWRIVLIYTKSDGTAISTDIQFLNATSLNWLFAKTSSLVPANAARCSAAIQSWFWANSVDVADLRVARTEFNSTVGSVFGTNAYRADGSTLVTDAAAITSLGTAAAVAGQGALATLNSVDLATTQVVGKVAANIAYGSGATVESLKPAQASADVTASNTAAAIASQGALATLGSVALGSGGRVYRDDGSTHLTDAIAVTSLGTASAIASQGALATKNSASLDSDVADGTTYKRYAATEQTKLLGIQALADVTSSHTAAAIAGQGALATKTTADYGSDISGTKPDQYAVNDDNLVPNNSLVTDSSTWTFTGSAVRYVSATAGDPAKAFLRATGAGGVAYVRGNGQIPINGGQSLFVSGWIRSDNVGNLWQTIIVCYAADGTTIVFNGAGTNLYPTAANTWQFVKYIFTPPANAAFIVFQLGLNMGAGGTYFDLALPRVSRSELGADITATNPKVQSTNYYATPEDNLIPNGDFSDPTGLTNNWSFDTPTKATVMAAANGDPASHFLRMILDCSNVRSRSGTPIPVVSGKMLYLDWWMRSNDATQPTSFSFVLYKADGVTTSTSGTFFISSPFYGSPANTWVHQNYTIGPIPSDTAFVVFYFASYGWPAGVNVDVTKFRLSHTQLSATFGATAGTNTYRSDGTTVMSQAEIRTSEGTAAAITSQGALATLSAVDLSTSQVTNKSLANVDATANTKLSGIQALADVTSSHTASAIASQGSLATLNAVDFATTQVTNKTATNITYTGGATVDSLKPAQVGADVTSSHTASAISGQGSLATKNTASLDSDVTDGSTYARVVASSLSSGVPKLAVAGSGTKLGDARNAPNVISQNLGYKIPTAPTYSAAAGTPATATISMGAFTIYNGVTVSYSACSASVTGTGGTTITYYLYIDDPANAGGSQTLVATTTGTDVYSGTNRIFVGQVDVTYPTSGTGSGTGGGGGGGGAGGNCVTEDTWLRCGKQAKDVEVGDFLDVADPETLAIRKGRVSHSSRALERCVRIRTVAGSELDCSLTAPIGLSDGGQALAEDLLGHTIPVCKNGRWSDELVRSVTPIGEKWVRHITCENTFFLAGRQMGCYLLHHNLKVDP